MPMGATPADRLGSEMPQPAASATEPVTLQAIEGLLKRTLAPVQDDISELRDKFIAFSVTTTKDAQEMRADMKKVTAEAGEAKKRADAAMASISNLKDEFERRVASITNSAASSPQWSAREATIVLGGLGDNWEAAKDFVSGEVSKERLPEPFFKGDQFRGVMFYKYDNANEANQMVTHFDRKKTQYKGQNVWCKHDSPIAQRVPLSFILGVRRLLISWGYNRKNLKVDDSIPRLSVGGDDVVTASVVDNELKVDWLHSDWSSWTELVNALEFKALIDAAGTRLAQAAESRTKGGGKGHKGPRSQ